jgi:hypothetical protein
MCHALEKVQKVKYIRERRDDCRRLFTSKFNFLIPKVFYLITAYLRFRSTKVESKMTNENVETLKSDVKKAVSDLENIVSHAKADIKADTEKAKADAKNKLAHVKADSSKEISKFQ